MKAIILSNGFRKHLNEPNQREIQPMTSIAGKPFLEHQIRFLKDNEINEIILVVHNNADKIKSYFGTGHRWGVNITYSEEEVPLGTAGAIKNAEKYIDDTFLVLNGDSYSQIDIKDFVNFHKTKKSNFTISLTYAKYLGHYGSAVVNENKISKFSESEKNSDVVSTGVYIFEPIIFDYIEKRKNLSLEEDIFPKLSEQGLLYGYIFDGYFVSLGKPETYRKFKEDVLETLMLREYHQVGDAMRKIGKSDIDLVLVVDSQKRLLGVLNNKIIRNHFLRGGSVNDAIVNAMVKDPLTARTSDDKNKISKILLEGTHRLPILDDFGRVVDVEFHTEKIKAERFPIVRGRAPLRISFAGGGTDLPNFFEKYGGVVISGTINKYCYATIVKRADSRIIIDSDVTPEKDVIVSSIDNLEYDGKLDLVKAIIKTMNPDFGFELYMHNDIPPGRGLGSSASMAILLVSLFSYIQDIHYDDYKVAEIAYRAEKDELGIKGGLQDQYASVTGGFNFMEFSNEKTIIYPLNLKEEVINELNEHLILCYVGNTHYSGEQQQELQKNIASNEEERISNLNDLKKIAVEIKDCLLTNNLEKIGELLHISWEKKKNLSNKISNPKIDELYSIGIENGAYGGKLLGSGGGGYILFFVNPQKRIQVKKALEKNSGEVMNFKFEFDGVKMWPVKSKF